MISKIIRSISVSSKAKGELPFRADFLLRQATREKTPSVATIAALSVQNSIGVKINSLATFSKGDFSFFSEAQNLPPRHQPRLLFLTKFSTTLRLIDQSFDRCSLKTRREIVFVARLIFAANSKKENWNPRQLLPEPRAKQPFLSPKNWSHLARKVALLAIYTWRRRQPKPPAKSPDRQGKDKPRILATLSNASPTASSWVSPRNLKIAVTTKQHNLRMSAATTSAKKEILADFRSKSSHKRALQRDEQGRTACWKFRRKY